MPHLVILGTFLDRFATQASATLPLGTASQALDPVGAQLTSLERVMRDADVVVCLAPLTPGTHRMIGAAELAWLEPDSVFVNVSRGAIVDSDALIERARQGDIRVSLDVFDPEPIPAGSPIRDLSNVFLSPHIAGGAPRRRASGIPEIVV